MLFYFILIFKDYTFYVLIKLVRLSLLFVLRSITRLDSTCIVSEGETEFGYFN